MGLCRFCLHFLEFGHVTKIFYVPDFFSVFFEKSRQKWVPTFSMFFQKYFCVFYCVNFWKRIEKCWDSRFCLDFSKKQVWDIEKIWNIPQPNLEKIKTKTTESQHFSMLKFLDGHSFDWKNDTSEIVISRFKWKWVFSISLFQKTYFHVTC